MRNPDDMPTPRERLIGYDADLDASTRRGCSRAVAVVFIPLLPAARAAVLYYLWAWFVTPATGWPPIGYWVAFGLALLPNALHRPDSRDITDGDTGPFVMMTAGIVGLISYAVTLALGLIVHLIAT